MHVRNQNWEAGKREQTKFLHFDTLNFLSTCTYFILQRFLRLSWSKDYLSLREKHKCLLQSCFLVALYVFQKWKIFSCKLDILNINYVFLLHFLFWYSCVYIPSDVLWWPTGWKILPQVGRGRDGRGGLISELPRLYSFQKSMNSSLLRWKFSFKWMISVTKLGNTSIPSKPQSIFKSLTNYICVPHYL